MFAKVLIATVGQTPEPIEYAMVEHTPHAVVFIASQQSQVVVAQLLQAHGDSLQHHTLLLDDPESLTHSYRKALEALQWALRWEARTIVADITGGTKPMVAGVMLALSGRGVTFSYVGGDKRDAGGRVQSGSERLKLLEDPSTLFGHREWQEFSSAWNQGQFQAAVLPLEYLLQRELTPTQHRFYTHLKAVTQAVVAWDRFQHRQAHDALQKHLEPALAIAEAWGHGSKVRVLQSLEEALVDLQSLVLLGPVPSMALLRDLLANAMRRAAAGRYDDALARLYRAIELAAEADIYERYQVVLRQPKTYPTKWHTSYAQRAAKVLGLKEALSLACDIDLLHGRTNTLAQNLYGEYSGVLSDLLARRHQSILAHGTTPVLQQDYQALHEYLGAKGLQAAKAWGRW